MYTSKKDLWERDRTRLWKEFKRTCPELNEEQIEEMVSKVIGACPTDSPSIVKSVPPKPKQLPLKLRTKQLTLSTIERSILEFIRSKGEFGAIADEAEAVLAIRESISSHTFSGAFQRLRDASLICKNGKMRQTRKDNPASVHVASEFMPSGGRNE